MNKKNVTTYDPTDNNSWSQSYNMHWVTIAEIKEDLITNKTTMKVSSWGGYAYIDVDDYVDGENLYKAIVFFTKK